MGAFEKNTYTESFGGEGGSFFSDSPAVVKSGPITRIDLRYGAYLDAIQVTYGNSTGEHFGGHMGDSACYLVPEGHEIISVNLRAEAFIDGIQFISIHPDRPDSLQESPWYGGEGGNFYSATSPGGGLLREISGRAGAFIDQLDLTFLEAEVGIEVKKEAAPKVKKTSPAGKKKASKAEPRNGKVSKAEAKKGSTPKAEAKPVSEKKAPATKKSPGKEKKENPQPDSPVGKESETPTKQNKPQSSVKGSTANKSTTQRKAPAKKPSAPKAKTTPAKKPAAKANTSVAKKADPKPEEARIAQAPKTKKSYYRTIKGVKYDRGLLETAQSLVEGPGDGRISKADAEQLWKAASDGPGITTVEKRTLEYILENFNVTPPAQKWLKDQLGQ